MILQVIVDKEGKVEPQKVLKGLPMGLSEAAMAAMGRCRFEPATLEGQPVSVYYNLTVSFSLQ